MKHHPCIKTLHGQTRTGYDNYPSKVHLQQEMTGKERCGLMLPPIFHKMTINVSQCRKGVLCFTNCCFLFSFNQADDIKYCSGNVDNQVTQYETGENIFECTNLYGHFLISKHSF